MKTKILLLVIISFLVCLSVVLYEFARYRGSKAVVVGVPGGKGAKFRIKSLGGGEAVLYRDSMPEMTIETVNQPTDEWLHGQDTVKTE